MPASPAPRVPAPNILGTWYITRSTNPIWSDKRNVTTTLTLEGHTDGNRHRGTKNTHADVDKNDTTADDDDESAGEYLPLSALCGPESIILANRLSYQTLGSESVKITKGTDRAVDSLSRSSSPTGGGSGNEGPIQMEWRGTGWLRMVRARWEILGWGRGWFVAYAEKSMFASAGISLYSRRRTVEGEEWVGIERELRQLVERYPGEEELRKLVLGMRAVRQD